MEKLKIELEQLLNGYPEVEQRKALMEAASRIGTKEWQDEVKELIRRMNDL